MLRDLGDFLNPHALQILSAVASITSVLVALQTTISVLKMLRRNHRAKKEFKAEVDPWMNEAKQKYIKERFESSSAQR